MLHEKVYATQKKSVMPSEVGHSDDETEGVPEASWNYQKLQSPFWRQPFFSDHAQ